MVVVLVIVFLLLLLLGFLVFTPVTIKIDTYNNQYYLHLRGIIKCTVLWQDGPLIKIQLPFYRFDFDPVAKIMKKKEKKIKRKKRRRSKGSSLSLKKITRVMRSFKIREFKIDLDTSDVIWNAYLYPFFFFLNTNKTPLTINYEGRVGVLVLIENRLARMIWAFLK